MTKDEALALPAGDELNAVIAEKIFGTEVRWEESSGGFRFPVRDVDQGPKLGVITSLLPEYSESIEAAWQVLEKLRSVRAYVSVTADETGWFTDCFTTIKVDFISGLGDTAPLAICRAAIQACWQD